MMVKFFLEPFESIDKHCYQHPIIVLAEGLRSLNIPYIGNIDYWYDLDINDYLIAKDNRSNFDIAVFSHHYALRNDTTLTKARVRVVTDLCDGHYGCMNEIGPLKYDIYLKAHYNINFEYDHNVHPWAFGLTERMIKAIDAVKVNSEHITHSVLDSFRVFHPLRERLLNELKKAGVVINQFEDSQTDEKYPSYSAQTGRRHSLTYYQELNTNAFCLAYGGYFMIKPKLPRVVRSLIYRVVDKRGLFIHPFTHTITQHDSWRFWESMYSQSIPIHVNFDEWGLKFPEQPLPHVHYIPTAIDKLGVFNYEMSQIDRLRHESRKFAYQHYAPKPTAQRFLKLIEYT